MNSSSDDLKKQQAAEISENLKKVFGEYGTGEAPEDLKDEVFKTLDTLELIGNIADLFTVKFSRSETELLAGGKEDEEDPDED